MKGDFNMLKKFSLIFITIFIFILILSISAAADEINGYVPPPIDLSYLADNPPKEIYEENGFPLLRDSSIPSKYDLREYGYVSNVKNQTPYGTCWAFAAIGSMESNYLMKGNKLDLSEMHLAWYTYRNSNKYKAFKNLSSAALKTVLDTGGNSFYPAAVYGRLDGPVLESEVPYGENKQPSASTPESYERVLRLRDVYYLAYSTNNVNGSTDNRNIIKKRIMDTGAVVANYANGDITGYKQVADNEISFYTKSTAVSHAVLIIGWDDNYSKDNFKTKPSSDGAWLIKNSWGTKWSNGSVNVENSDGCFWMSYEQYLTDGSAFIVEDANDDMKAYYYDALGWTGTASGAYAANVFQSERENEVLTEVAFYTPDNNVNYEINVYTGMTSMPKSNPVNGLSVSKQTGTESFAGYHTITLNDPVALTKGEYFSVVVKFTNTTSIPVEYKSSKNGNTNTKIETGSFTSSNGLYWFAQTDSNTCVRAFTLKDSAEGIAPKITTEMLPEGLLDVEYIYKAQASGSRPLTWSLSGNIPDGLDINPNTGLISGTPTKKGNYTFSVNVENSNGNNSKNFTINVTDMPQITTTEINGYVGCTVSESIKLSAGTAKTWEIKSGTLPKGLKFNTTTGALTGKPTKQGSNSVTFKASSTAWEVDKSVTFTIGAKPVKPTISTSKLKDGEVDKEYSAVIAVKGTEPVTLSIEGLPNGLSMTPSGAISGTPEEAGNFTMTITASNLYTELNNVTVTKKVRLKIQAQVPVFEEVSEMPMAIVNKEFSGYTFELSSGTKPITWTASGLPKGLTLSQNGDLSGTPARAGNFKMNIKAKNFSGQKSLMVPLTVYEIPTVTTAKLSNATTGKKYTAKLSAKGTTPITWNVQGLPDTLTVTPNAKGNQATISGIPTEAKTYELAITASNAAGTSEVKTLSLTVNGVAPKLTASLAKGKVGTDYTGSKISATGTFPIEFSYEIKDSDKTKFGINDLNDIGLSFSYDKSTGTAEIKGEPDQSIKNLPIYITASNVVKSVTKKLNFTAQGTKPSFESSTPGTVTQAASSNAEIKVRVSGTPKITFSMNKVKGFTLTQDDDYSATISGTTSSKAGKVSIRVTAANPDGKTTKTIVIQTTKSTANDSSEVLDDAEILREAQEKLEELEAVNNENTQTNQEAVKYLGKNSGVVKLGGQRSIKSLGSNELNILKGYTAAAVMPELTVTESGMYDFEIELEPEIEAGKELAWFAFVKNREKNSDDEIVEFYDIEGSEITETTDEHKILISVWLNAGDTYAPIIAVKDSE